MSIVSRLFAAAFVMAAVLATPATAAAPVENYVYGTTHGVSVSPSGKFIAVISSAKPDANQLVIFPFANGKTQTGEALGLNDLMPIDVTFKTDDLLLVTVVQKNVRITNVRNRDGDAVKGNRSFVISMKRNGADPKVLLSDREQIIRQEVVAPLYDDPDHVLLGVNELGRGSSSLYRVNVTTGDFDVVERGRFAETRIGSRTRSTVQTAGWAVDRNGTAYLRIDLNVAKSEATVWGRPIGGDWNAIARYPLIENSPNIEFSGLASPNSVYGFDRAGGDFREVWEYDLSTGKPLRRVKAVAGAEAAGISINPYTGAYQGALFRASGSAKAYYSDKALAAAQQVIDESFPEYQMNRIAAYSRDFGVLAVVLGGPNLPSLFAVIDVRAMDSTAIGASHALGSGDLGRVSTITYPSSDGRMITAFLTMPPGVSKNAPLVVMPHGGPEAQDTLGFDTWRQFLASRGYAVLQPQFRGSDGYGLSHERAGHLNWGALVQDDARAGVARLVQEGLVDANRMCIFGWSYGGYMAMAGATMSPDLYKCAVAGAGVSDLNAMIKWEKEQGGADSRAVVYWTARMGNDEQARKASPVAYVDAVKIPVLLIHGERDSVVPIEQSEIFEKALKAAGKTVTFIRFPDQEHSFDDKEWVDMFKHVEAFLAANIGR